MQAIVSGLVMGSIYALIAQGYYITSITTGTSQFTPTKNTCGASLPLGGKCKVAVQFTPAASGLQMDTLTIKDNGTNSPQTVPLQGVGR